MKKIRNWTIAILVVAGAIYGVELYKDRQSPSEETCKNLNEFSSGVMTARQTGEKRENLEHRLVNAVNFTVQSGLLEPWLAPFYVSLIEDAVVKAYQEPLHSSDQAKLHAVAEFQSEMYELCVPRADAFIQQQANAALQSAIERARAKER